MYTLTNTPDTLSQPSKQPFTHPIPRQIRKVTREVLTKETRKTAAFGRQANVLYQQTPL